MRASKSAIFGGAAILWFGVAAGCSRGPAPEDTVRTFLEASDRDDKPAAMAMLTKKAQAFFKDGKSDGMDKVQNYQIGASTVMGDSATVRVDATESGKPQKVDFLLRQEEGAWRIYGMAISMEPGGGKLTLNFEKPEEMLGEMFKGMGQAMSKGLEEIGKGMGKALESAGKGMQDGLQQPASSPK